MAQALQHDRTALIAELPAPGAANIGADTAASGSERSDAVVSIPLVQNIRQVTRANVASESPAPIGKVAGASDGRVLNLISTPSDAKQCLMLVDLEF